LTKRDASRQESADLYPHVTVQLGPQWRIVECRDGEQWILQHRSNKWESRAYCRTSAALERLVRDHVGDVELPDLPAWLKQPVRYKNGARVDSGAVEAHSPIPAMKSRPAGLQIDPGGRLSACGGWRLRGPELDERELRFATIAWNDNVVPPAPIPVPPKPAIPLEPDVVAVAPSAVPIAPADVQADPLAIPAFLRRVSA
jgi:hypothetical protein